ncbi:hypothetical protein GCM10008904_21340 [Paraclostridium ghonii]|uniref:Polyketide synthase PksN n=1 Tax=Paraclostridium ghonii TaxID=29358 RepID=A0ABU0N086_9FIRM|nr:type I polyketide synthase [Paeniclostridium ghonii]MDQ0556526.1 polyketide synthase PksN [Paeniclostridium ghonii]
MVRLLDFKGKTLDAIKGVKDVQEASKKDIAIIGMSGIIGDTQNLQEFWDKLTIGTDFVKELSEERKLNNIAYIKHLQSYGLLKDGAQYLNGTYLNEIENFDYEFFSISRREACNMDPNQRKFAQVAYHAIEDAGYGGEKLKGSKTGVFLGYSDDFYDNYKNNILINNSSSLGLSLVGNVRSIIASRISYYLDLKGPSITFDTACSSSLIAIKEACTHIANGECDMAIAGGVKLIIAPIKGNDNWEVKIQSDDCRARTFDDGSTGTGIGEGIIAFVLKPLDKAIEDRDNIHAVIKSWAANQDGKSIGITAPNPKAQEELVLKLLNDSNTNPEEINCIEAHGTGTKLGDPIEVMALTNVFGKFTNKKQYCAITSVKTNIGHLDSASGAAGLAKAVLCLKNDKLVPHLHFKKINRNIDLINSPFYIPDMLTEIGYESRKNKMIISSFGLSGTNCQLLIEKAPTIQKQCQHFNRYILTISAKNEKSFNEYIRNHRSFIQDNNMLDLGDYVFTSSTGRGHFSYRCAILFNDREDLTRKLNEIIENNHKNEIDGVYMGRHKVVEKYTHKTYDYEITLEEKEKIDLEAKNVLIGDKNLELICELYIKGANISWDTFYRKYNCNKVSLPVYPFSEVKCWVNKDMDYFDIRLLTECYDFDIFSLNLSCRQWVLAEHIVDGYNVLPGTAHIEIISNIFRRYYDKAIEIMDLVFMKPISLMKDSEKEIQIRLNKKDNEIILNSKEDGKWIEHSRAYIKEVEINNEVIDVDNLINNSKYIKAIEERPFKDGFVATGPRWDNVRKVYLSDNYVLGYLELNKKLINDLDNYKLHPALLDCAVNLGKEKLNDLNYLPFKYNSIKIYENLKDKFYTHIVLKNNKSTNGEILTFDIKLINTNGRVFLEIKDYSIKKVNLGFMQKNYLENKIGYFDLILKNKNLEKADFDFKDKVLIVKDEGEQFRQITELLDYNGIEYFIVDNTITNSELIKILENIPIGQIIHMSSLLQNSNIETISDFEKTQDMGVYSLFNLVKIITQSKIRKKLNISILGNRTKNADCISLYGLGKVIEKEFDGLSCKVIDFDDLTDTNNIFNEIFTATNENVIIYKENSRYIHELSEIDLEKYEKLEINFFSEGVYIITGGTGSIGLQCCNWLLEKGAKNIALLSRSGTIKDESNEEYIKSVKNKHGAQILIYNGDISNYEDAKEIIDKLKNRFNKINGVIHCAGNAGDGFIINKDFEKFNEVLKPKVQGTWILDKLLENEKLEFFILMSSITSLTADAGQSDYTAANCYLNGFAESKRKQGKKYISVNWPAWKEVGMAVRYGVNEANGLLKSISNSHAIKVLDQLVCLDIPNVIVGELNLSLLSKIKNEITINISNGIIKRLPKNTENNAASKNLVEVSINGKDELQIDDIERSVAKSWANVLQIEELNVNDNFNSLGGDSILAVRLLKELNREFESIIDISDIFTYPTVEQMSSYIRNQKTKQVVINNEEELLDDILDKLENGEVLVDEIDDLFNTN